MIPLFNNKGQSLVETAIALPILLLLLAGAYACCRSSFLVSAAESGAHTQMLRAGRGLPGIERNISDSISPERGVARIRTDNSDKSRMLPSPFPAIAGRTKGIADIRKTWDEAGGYAGFPVLQASRIAEASVDCWGKQTASGRKIKGAVGVYVATGILR